MMGPASVVGILVEEESELLRPSSCSLAQGRKTGRKGGRKEGRKEGR
jgi:hypothetical protein